MGQALVTVFEARQGEAIHDFQFVQHARQFWFCVNCFLCFRLESQAWEVSKTSGYTMHEAFPGKISSTQLRKERKLNILMTPNAIVRDSRPLVCVQKYTSVQVYIFAVRLGLSIAKVFG